MTARYLVGDTRDIVASLPDDSADLILTSPPFLALRSYLPADHPDKGREIGSEPCPAAFLDTLLDLVEEWDRVLAPHGSIAVELGDTFAGSGGAGGDYNPDGLRDGQERFDGSARRGRPERGIPGVMSPGGTLGTKTVAMSGAGWPDAKSLCLIPQLFAASLAYGRNLLRPERETPRWRVRNWITWGRPNPPVGALGDKVRPASSFFTVATKSPRRWFDLDAVRVPYSDLTMRVKGEAWARGDVGFKTGPKAASGETGRPMAESRATHAGAPPLDFWLDGYSDDEHATALLVQATQPYSGAHYATWPAAVAKRMVDMMCPLRVCRVCGEPSRRIVEQVVPRIVHADDSGKDRVRGRHTGGAFVKADTSQVAEYATVGWSDCGHDDYRPGLVLDPFVGSGTTLAVCSGVGRDSIGIDLDARNSELALERVGPLLLTVETFASVSEGTT